MAVDHEARATWWRRVLCWLGFHGRHVTGEVCRYCGEVIAWA